MQEFFDKTFVSLKYPFVGVLDQVITPGTIFTDRHLPRKMFSVTTNLILPSLSMNHHNFNAICYLTNGSALLEKITLLFYHGFIYENKHIFQLLPHLVIFLYNKYTFSLKCFIGKDN